MNTENTLSRFQECFLQLFIKDRSKKVNQVRLYNIKFHINTCRLSYLWVHKLLYHKSDDDIGAVMDILVITNHNTDYWRHVHLIHYMWSNSKLKQAQRRAAAETAAFIKVVRYNDKSSFNLDNDFEMNQVSTKTWPHMGPIWATIWAPYDQPIWGQYGFCPPVSYGFHVECGFPIWVPASAHIFPRYCQPFCPVGPGTVLVRLFQKGLKWVAHLGVPRSYLKATLHDLLCNELQCGNELWAIRQILSFLGYHENWLLI